ncbi:MAG: hypothetical protein V1807_02425 [Patescibacteria group bacterium]
MVKRGFAFEKVFKKKLPPALASTIRPCVSFYTTKPSLVQPRKHRLKKLAWTPKFKHKSLSTVAAPLLRTLVGAGLIVLFYWVFGSHFFVLDQLDIQGNRLVDNQTLVDTIFKQEFKGVNALLFNEVKAMRQAMTISQIKTIDFHKNIWQHQLQIIIEEHETSLIWRTNNEQFLVNRAGVVYDIAPPDSPLLVVEDLKNVPVSLKQQILTTDFIEFVNFVAANLPRKTNLNVRQIVVPETTFEVEVITNEGWKIIFDATKSPDTQLNNLAKILRDGAHPRQYVDLRILDRVYYK